MTALVTGVRRRDRQRDRREAPGRGLRSEGARPRLGLRRLRPGRLGARRLGRPRLPERGRPHRQRRDRDADATTQYRRAVGVNVDGVVYGVRRLDRVMPKGSTIVVTASLAGLVGIADDPIYGLTKHAVVGFVRSVAPQLAERGIRIQAVCPGWADTALTTPEFRQELEERGFRLLSPEAVAEGVWAAYKSEGTGEAWIVQPGREPLLYEFKGVPGPR